jgi:hypothetical protein
MPVDSKHSQYSTREKQWARCRDAVEGQDAIKAKTTRYLPMLSGQDTLEYDSYLNRALFFGAAGRTVDGLTGAVFRKQYVLEYPESKKPELDDITEESSSVDVLLRRTLREVLTVGRLGLLVDATPEDEGDTRVYVSQYIAENILNWRMQRVNGKNTLVFLTLRETYEDSGDDEFERVLRDQIRVCWLSGQDGQIIYNQAVYRKPKNKDQFIQHSVSTPKRNGKTLDFIPFKFINATHDEPNPVKPPLLDIVDVNLSHFRTSADLEHGAHYTALPTPVLSGFNTKKTYRIGSGTAWVTENPQGRAVYLEYTGQGLQALRDIKQDKEAQMAVLGARMLEQQKRTAETAETHRIRSAAESGPLAATVGVAEEALTQILRWHCEWSGASDAQVAEIELMLNKDFISTRMSAQDLTALMQARQAGEISQDTFLHNLKQGEILPDDTSIEDEKDNIEVDGNRAGDTLNAGPEVPIKREFELVRDATGKAAGIKEA